MNSTKDTNYENGRKKREKERERDNASLASVYFLMPHFFNKQFFLFCFLTLEFVGSLSEIRFLYLVKCRRTDIRHKEIYVQTAGVKVSPVSWR